MSLLKPIKPHLYVALGMLIVSLLIIDVAKLTDHPIPPAVFEAHAYNRFTVFKGEQPIAYVAYDNLIASDHFIPEPEVAVVAPMVPLPKEDDWIDVIYTMHGEKSTCTMNKVTWPARIHDHDVGMSCDFNDAYKLLDQISHRGKAK